VLIILNSSAQLVASMHAAVSVAHAADLDRPDTAAAMAAPAASDSAAHARAA
jgi:hypothetical protein